MHFWEISNYFQSYKCFTMDKAIDLIFYESLNYNSKIDFNKYDWIIDGIFGIGLSNKINEIY